MEITEVRIKLMEEDSAERLKAFCSITFDDAFVIRDLKIIEGASGPFVAMPSRKLTAHCPKCNYKNHLRAAYCNQCGRQLGEARIAKDEEGRSKLYADIAHPIHSDCRDMIQRRVVQEFQAEQERMKREGKDYVSRYDDPDGDVRFGETPAGRAARPQPSPGEGSVARTRIEGSESIPRRPHHRDSSSPARPANESSEKRSTQPPPPNDSNLESFGEGVF